MIRSFRLASLALLALLCFSGGKRQKHVVSFHVEAPEFQRSRKTVFEFPPGSETYYLRAPSVYWKQISGHMPFVGDDGNWGTVFSLTTGGRNALAGTASFGEGKHLLAMVGGSPRYVLKIDKAPRDPYLVIWEGITDEDIAVFDKKFGRFK